MVAFNFQGRFVPLIENLTKRQTIRQTARAKPGDRLQLYTGQRTAACRRLVDPDPVCELVQYVALRPEYVTFGNLAALPPEFEDRDEFARADGFADYREMLDWFEQQYRTRYFVGRLTRWRPWLEDPILSERIAA
ncbi:hypothetical protein SAMN05216566_11456 [Aureimonas phyllosphaerae]|nr:hypothetical protein SAMN05216566_11456 [Aureimonas phyllosphaerae]